MWVDQRRARDGELVWAQRGKDIVARHAHRAELGDHANRAVDAGCILIQFFLCARKWLGPKE